MTNVSTGVPKCVDAVRRVRREIRRAIWMSAGALVAGVALLVALLTAREAVVLYYL